MIAIANDLELYERHADEWWDERSPAFRSLRATKKLHIELIERLVDEEFGGRVGLLVDVGCGGGLLSVPLADRAERVIGVDRSRASTRAASDEARRTGRRCTFMNGDAVDVPLADGCADLVLLSDVVEHVVEPARCLVEAARLLRPGGVLFVNTIARTRRAKFLAVTFAEGVGLVPRGTHDAEMFVSPDELVEMASRAGLDLVRLEGEAPRVWATIRTWAIHLRRSRNTSVSYHAVFRKPALDPSEVTP
ncbi:MAG: bifunctional 2-polyprenyl-6-hydroxyphenol methylase/3-demethylubiquinol 3-O-methyltransferase UbiG [Planctomycetota bacterium]